jgi:hypothetical protein
VLSRRPIGVRAVINIVANACWQQLRTQEPWVIIAVPLFVWSLVVWSILVVSGNPVRLRGNPPASAVLATCVFLGTGFWTRLRSGRGGGRAAMKVSIVATLPIFLVGLLLLSGAARAIPGVNGVFSFFLSPSMPRSQDTDLLITLLAGPVLQIPFAGLIGWIGGLAGRVARRAR